ncbi:MAG: hypothetical protein H6673_08475 [Anaerolineales bacterium]|nr:hypothetical protein [Anaerolineales bacterium]
MTAQPTPLIIYDPSHHVAGVRFQKLGKLYHFVYDEYPYLNTGDFVIVETVRGQQMGQVIGFVERTNEREYKDILRIATPRDLLLKQQWEAKEVEALIDCRDTAAQVGGYRNVKFVKAEYSFNGANLTLMYQTDDEFNPAPLFKALRKHNTANIDFRQIGPRDVARIMGGQGACGGPRCCSTFLTDFSPVSIKMAKTQGIPLNPTEITGMCGRLRCCLIYEYEQYVEARKQLPRRNKVVGTPHGEGRVIEIFPLRDGVNVVVEEQVHFVPREEIVPLEEFRALQDKAAAGCSKNETGACDCGARRPKSAQQDLNAALEMAHGVAEAGEAEDGIEDAVAEAPAAEEEHSDKGKRSRRRKRRPDHRASSTTGGTATGEHPAANVTHSEGTTRPPKPSKERGERGSRTHRRRRSRPKGGASEGGSSE